MTDTQELNWEELERLALNLGQSGVSPGSIPQTEWDKIERALDTLNAHENWAGLVRLRKIFQNLIARDSVTVIPIFQRLSREAIIAAETTGNRAELAQLLAAEGHNLHRQGYHRQAINVFERSAELFQQLGEDFEALQNFYMTSLCHRALENRVQARRVLETVLDQIDERDLWRANPLQVLAWLAQDEGQLDEAERLLREALHLYRLSSESEMQVVGTLADLAEVVGLRSGLDEAVILFEESLAILRAYEGQYDRLQARTQLKLAELLIRRGECEAAQRLLNQADDKIRSYGHYYDLLWRIETTRAYAFFKQRRWSSMIRKLRMALYYRDQIGLSNALFAKQLIRRFFMGTGLPR